MLAPLGMDCNVSISPPVRGSNLNRRPAAAARQHRRPPPDRVRIGAAAEWGGDYLGWGGSAAEMMITQTRRSSQLHAARSARQTPLCPCPLEKASRPMAPDNAAAITNGRLPIGDADEPFLACP